MSALPYRHPNDPNAAFPEPRHIEQDELDFEIALHIERLPQLFPEEYASGTDKERAVLVYTTAEALRHDTPANWEAIGRAFANCVRDHMNEDAEAVIRKEERT